MKYFRLLNSILVFSSFMLPAHLQASEVTFTYEGRITVISDSSVFGGLLVGDFVSGIFSYDTATTPDSTEGFWQANYLLDGPENQITSSVNGAIHFDTFEARVKQGPALPFVSKDSVVIFSPGTDWTNLRSGSPRSSINLIFDPSASDFFPLDSTSLPPNLNLTMFPLSSGSISLITGTVPDSDLYYLLDRSFDPDPGVVQRSDGSSIPLSEGNTQYAVYLEWLAAGNEPLY